VTSLVTSGDQGQTLSVLDDFPDSPRWREILPPLGRFVHRRFDLKPAVEIVLGRIDGDAISAKN
jgi:hypothetical protein